MDCDDVYVLTLTTKFFRCVGKVVCVIYRLELDLPVFRADPLQIFGFVWSVARLM